MIEIHSSAPADTLTLGRKLAGLLRPGDVVLLTGKLGAGKTLLAAGVAEGLGVSEQVTSPSFVLVRVYRGFIPLVHADVYRLGSTGEFDDLELPEIASDGVLLVEWGDAIEASVPDDRLVVELVVNDDETRDIVLRPEGTWTTRPLMELSA